MKDIKLFKSYSNEGELLAYVLTSSRPSGTIASSYGLCWLPVAATKENLLSWKML